MKAPQLFCGALAVVMSVSACQKRTSQVELKQSANDAATRVKTGAVRAGSELSDMWLATKIHSKFIGDRDIKARDINVSSHDGVVTLNGRVLNESAHQLALTIARNTDGVTQVVDHLDVEVAGPAAPPIGAANGDTRGAVATTGTTSSPTTAANSDDARITTSIQSKYFLDDRIKGRHINVATNGGVVTLHGEVADETERAEALLLARTSEGVKRVEDNLTITIASAPTPTAASTSASAPAATSSSSTSTSPPTAAPTTIAGTNADATLADRIKSQLSSDNQIKNTPIDVTAKSGVVFLQGTVPSSAIKEHALSVARGTDGVTQVVDRIQISSRGASTTKSVKSNTSRAKRSAARKAKR